TSSVSAIVITLLTCVISFILELRTLIFYRRLSAQLRRDRLEDYRLLLYALCGFVAQLLFAAYYLHFALELLYPGMIAKTQPLVAYLIDVISLSGSICLVVT
ncbi:hypothetical protein AAVH_42197, partial [Aphelenchoides avenae]